MNKNILEKYIKQEEQKEIIEIFDNIFQMAIDSNRNKEFYDELKNSKEIALKENLRGKDLEKFVEPFIKALDDDNLESKISKEEKEQERAIWENYDLIVKRNAIKSNLNFIVKQFIIKARNNNANDDFIELVKDKQKEAYKLAFDLESIHNMLKALEYSIYDKKYQLNSNQITTKGKFDNLIYELIDICKDENIIINQYNSGEYDNKDSSLWTEIFNLKNEAIKADVAQAIVDRIITDLTNKKDKIIKHIKLTRDIKEQKKIVQKQAKEYYLSTLTARQLEIRNKFLEFQQIFIGKCKKDFWDILFSKKKEAIEQEYDNNKIDSIFNFLESKSLEYLKY